MKLAKKREQNDRHESVLEHCRELLGIVFAKSTSADRVMKGLNVSFDTTSGGGTARSSPATITFAMRHRCLRVASILVPQEALEEVLREDDFATNASHSLKQCAFGAFCAKELEEMSLPIPHSDLLQLSHMHFPSYARALWRHHRDMKGPKGRLLLLILELYLKEPISDYSFFVSIIKEIEALRLPRTLLLAFECMVRYMERIGVDAVTSFIEATNHDMSRVITHLSNFVYADVKRAVNKTSESGETFDRDEIDSMVSTLSRLGRIIRAFSNATGGQMLLIEFSNGLLETLKSKTFSHEDGKRLHEIFQEAVSSIDSKETQKELFEKVRELHPAFCACDKGEVDCEDMHVLSSLVLANDGDKL